MAYDTTQYNLYQDCVCEMPSMGDESQDPNCPTCLEESEICELYIQCVDPEDSDLALNPIGGYVDGQPLCDDEEINATAIMTWMDTAVDNSAQGAVRKITGRGTATDAEGDQTPIGKGLFIKGKKTFTVTFEVLPLCQKTRCAMLALQCGGNVAFHYRTTGNGFYGGENGITAYVKDVSMPKEFDSYTKATITLEWSAKTDAPRDFYDI